ncbi:MAG: hypothetical protein HXX10_19775 [Rhodoplanes sp.]|uniref:hypothetical protein n=1 Tax=Rhodoplanes sp. TaxID=1968906 RepID=UPI0017E23448|nr:hypothetical protein [Rhodoplanes sp.]NVO16276.1 hypothetical protein [Rhodoplanes sp.]
MTARCALGVALAVSILAAAPAARAEDGCRSFAWSLGREKAWFAAGPATLGAGAPLPLGTAVEVALGPAAAVTWTSPPERAPKTPDTRGAVLPLAAVPTGVYQITLSAEAWIDVVQDGARLPSAGFSGRTDCPGLRKSVRFRLGSGPAVVQLSGATVDRLAIAVAPVEEAGR